MPENRNLWLVVVALLEAVAWSAVGLGAGLSAGGWVLDFGRVAEGKTFTLWSVMLTLAYTVYLILPGGLLGFGVRWLQRRLDSEMRASPTLRWSLPCVAAAAGLLWRVWAGFPR